MEETKTKHAAVTLEMVGAVFDRLGGLKGARRLLGGDAEIVHTIDCDADPHVPDGWEVEKHVGGGQFRWGPDKVRLYFAAEQKDGSIEGDRLYQKLKRQSVLNANALDFLLEFPCFIPEAFKELGLAAVFFWGTIYRNQEGRSCVRGFILHGDECRETSRCVDEDFNSHCFAAVSR